MSASASSTSFDGWLAERLQGLHVSQDDQEVFRPYILAILEDTEDEADEGGRGALEDALDSAIAGFTGDQAKIEALRTDIMRQWSATAHGKAGAAAAHCANTQHQQQVDLSSRLASIMESQTAAYKSAKERGAGSEPDKAVKEAILAQYSGAVEESSDEDDGESGAVGGEGGVASNVNAEAVAAAEAEKREKSRMAAQAKKDKDKEDREKQKKAQEDRKKKAQDKAAKGERRR